jgi:hypothetical protein
MSITSRSGTPSRWAIKLDLIGPHVAFVQGENLLFCLAQVEEQLLLGRGGTHSHQRPRAQDVLLNRSFDPPDGVGGQSDTTIRIEPVDRLHQPDGAFREQVGEWQAIAAVSLGDLRHEAQVARDKPVRGVAIAVLAPALGQHVFFLWLKQVGAMCRPYQSCYSGGSEIRRD